jgi:hypothetical protein
LFVFAPEDDEILILSNSVYDKFKRPREEIVIDEDDEDDDNEDDDEPEVKPQHSFKRHEDDNDDDEDEVGELQDNELLQAFDPTTWGMEPQSPWSQHEEHEQQNTLLVPLATEPVVPSLYTPEGVGLYLFNFVIYINFIVSYKAAGQLPILWQQVEELILTGMLPSEVYRQLGPEFYCTFHVNIRATHYNYMKQTYNLTDEQLLRSHQLDDWFVL